MEKQKLLFHQARLANRGVAEMILLHISACKGIPSEMVMKTLQLGISILRGGNIEIQMVSKRLCHPKSSSRSLLAKCNFIISGHVEPSERKERCRFLHINRWTDEFLQRAGPRCF